MNKTTQVGTLKCDPDLMQAQGSSGQQIAVVSIGVLDRNGIESTLEVKVWGGTGKEFAESCRKGQKVVFTGSLQVEIKELPSGTKNKCVQLIASGFLVVGENSPDKAINANPGSNNQDEPDIDLDKIPF